MKFMRGEGFFYTTKHVRAEREAGRERDSASVFPAPSGVGASPVHNAAHQAGSHL